MPACWRSVPTPACRQYTRGRRQGLPREPALCPTRTTSATPACWPIAPSPTGESADSGSPADGLDSTGRLRFARMKELESDGRQALVCFGRRRLRLHGREATLAGHGPRRCSGSGRFRVQEVAPNPACRGRSNATNDRSDAGLPEDDPSWAADGPISLGRRSPIFHATTSTRLACQSRASTRRAYTSNPRIADPGSFGRRCLWPRPGRRARGCFGRRRFRVRGRGERCRLAGGDPRIHRDRQSSDSMDDRLDSTDDEPEAASAAEGSWSTNTRLDSTDDERDSLGMTVPTPRTTTPIPSGKGLGLQGREVQRRFAGGRPRIHG